MARNSEKLLILKKTSPKIQNISNNRKLVTNLKDLAKTFNNFFVDISKQIDSNMVKTHKKYQVYLLNPIINTFRLALTKEVQSYINTPENIKSTDPSSIPNKLSKSFKKPLGEPITFS